MTGRKNLRSLGNNDLVTRKRSSFVWSYFEKINYRRVRCKLCQHEQNYQGTTGNILRHLRNKHSIIGTSKLQGDCDVILAEETDMDTYGVYEKEVIIKNETESLPRDRRVARAKVVSYCEEPDVDPYSEAAILLGEYFDSKSIKGTPIMKSKQNKESGKHKAGVEEERLLAEIDYFREKAAYYRMQKNLVALQVKKVKYELDQMG